MRRTPLEEAERWLSQAEEDLKWAKDLATRGGYHIACFLAQQVGEKAIEAFILLTVKRLCWDTPLNGCAGTPAVGSPSTPSA